MSGRIVTSLVVASVGLGIGSFSCSQPVDVAKGSSQELSLFTEWQRVDDRVEWVVELLESPMVVAIRPEKRFRTEVVDPRGLDSRRDWRTLAFLGDLAGEGRLRRIVREIMPVEEFDSLAARPAGYRILLDAWARGQTVLVLHCAEPVTFRDWVRGRGQEILDALDRAVVRGLTRTLYASDEQKLLEESVRERYGFTVRIPAGYEVSEDSTNKVIRMRFVRYEGPAQFFILHARPMAEASLDPQWGLRFRNELVYHYNEGDRVDFERSTGERTTFLGRPATRLRGLWQNEEYTMGGAFESILVALGERLVFMDMAVFHPTGDKLPYLRELRAIASTFTTGR